MERKFVGVSAARRQGGRRKFAGVSGASGMVHEEDILRGLSRNEARNVQGSQQQGGEEEICRGLSRRQEGGGCINL